MDVVQCQLGAVAFQPRNPATIETSDRSLWHSVKRKVDIDKFTCVVMSNDSHASGREGKGGFRGHPTPTPLFFSSKIFNTILYKGA